MRIKKHFDFQIFPGLNQSLQGGDGLAGTSQGKRNFECLL